MTESRINDYEEQIAMAERELVCIHHHRALPTQPLTHPTPLLYDSRPTVRKQCPQSLRRSLTCGTSWTCTQRVSLSTPC